MAAIEAYRKPVGHLRGRATSPSYSQAQHERHYRTHQRATKENALRRGRHHCDQDQLAPFTVRPLTEPSLRLVWYSLPSLSCW